MPTINTNVAAIKARSNLERVQRDLDTSITRLSSGKRIVTASDDAAGSAIAGRMESQIRGLNMTVKNAKDGQSLVDTQEGALQEISGILQRMRELAVQAASGIAKTQDKDFLNTEMTGLVSEISAISNNLRFNNIKTMSTVHHFYTDIDVAGTALTVAAGTATAQKLAVTMKNVSIGGGAPLATSKVLTIIDKALSTIDTRRATLGAQSNRFDHIIDNLTNVIANTESSKSRIEDADFAVETTAMTRNTVLQQAATSMIAQANASKNQILALIQG
jgi:flagellin